jgi:hypothetical protein
LTTRKGVIEAGAVDQDQALDTFRRLEREAKRNAAPHRYPRQTGALKIKFAQQR